MITDSGNITGPSQASALIGNPSPTNGSSNLQVVNNQGVTFSDTVYAAAKQVFHTFSFGAPNEAIAKATTGVAAAAQDVGHAVSAVATSAASGIRIGFILLIVVGGIILLGNLRRATG